MNSSSSSSSSSSDGEGEFHENVESPHNHQVEILPEQENEPSIEEVDQIFAEIDQVEEMEAEAELSGEEEAPPKSSSSSSSSNSSKRCASIGMLIDPEPIDYNGSGDTQMEKESLTTVTIDGGSTTKHYYEHRTTITTMNTVQTLDIEKNKNVITSSSSSSSSSSESEDEHGFKKTKIGKKNKKLNNEKIVDIPPSKVVPAEPILKQPTQSNSGFINPNAEIIVSPITPIDEEHPKPPSSGNCCSCFN